MNLGVGAYKDDNNQPFTFSAVKEAERLLLEASTNHEYLPISGLSSFYTSARDLLFGSDFTGTKEGKVSSVQTVSGTGALRLCSDFIKKHIPAATKVLISNPTWENHVKIFSDSGLGDKIMEYRYFDAESRGLDFHGMMEDLEAAPNGSILVSTVYSYNTYTNSYIY